MAKIINYKNLVKSVLEEKISARDSYPICYHYCITRLGYDSREMTAHKMLSLIKDHVLPSFETIHRTRRLIMEQNPKLRGTDYDKNQSLATEIKQEMLNEHKQ